MYIYIYIYIYTDRDREADRGNYRQTEKKRETSGFILP